MVRESMRDVIGATACRQAPSHLAGRALVQVHELGKAPYATFPSRTVIVPLRSSSPISPATSDSDICCWNSDDTVLASVFNRRGLAAFKLLSRESTTSMRSDSDFELADLTSGISSMDLTRWAKIFS